MTALTVAGGTFSVREFGAKGDGRSKDTVAFQRAIDAAAERGGGVVVEPGRYLCGTVHLRSHMTIRLLAGATVGGAGAAVVLPNDQKRTEYPESNMFGVPPAQALFARHVRGLQVSASRFRDGAADGRPYLALDDVRGGAFRDVEFGSLAPVAVLARRLSDFTFDGLAMPKGVASVRWQGARGSGVRFGAVARRKSTDL